MRVFNKKGFPLISGVDEIVNSSFISTQERKLHAVHTVKKVFNVSKK